MTEDNKNESRGRGKPSDYDPENYPRMAYVFCSEGGATDEELGRLFDVTSQTIINWRHKHPEFMEAVQTGKDFYDTENAEDSLKKLMKGFEYNEKTLIKKGDEVIYSRVVQKYQGPSMSAVAFWLKNRNRKRWKDYKAVEIGNLDDKPFATSKPAIEDGMTEQEMAAIYEDALKGE